jgi:hypothetical protein
VLYYRASLIQPEGTTPSTNPVLALLHSRNGLLSLSRTLQAQAAEHRQALVSRLQSQLTHLLTNALERLPHEGADDGRPQQGGSNSSGSSTSSSSRKSPQQLRRRCVAHCLRALSALRAPEVAEDLLRSSVVGPFVR